MMSLNAMKWAFDQQTKDATAKLVLVAIADHFNEDLGYSEWSSYSRIAKIGCCSEKTVQRKINELVAVGFINKVQRGFSKPNVYYLPIYEVYKKKQEMLHIGQSDHSIVDNHVQSIQDNAVQHGLDNRVQSRVDNHVQQTQYNSTINTNNMFGGQMKRELSEKQKKFIEVLIKKIQAKAHDSRFSYSNYEKIREEMKMGMLKKDGSFEKLCEYYELEI